MANTDLVAVRLQRLPTPHRNLLDDFFKTRRICTPTKLIYVKAVAAYTRFTDTPLGDLDKESLGALYAHIQEKVKPATIFLYMGRLRTLYAFNLRKKGSDDEDAEQAARKMFKEIPLSQLLKEANKKNELRNKIITPQEFQALLKAANHPRIRAWLMTSKEAGARPQEISTSRIRDLEFYEQYATLKVNGKTGERTIPLIRSIPYLRSWIQVHPDRDNPDAPLFATSHRGIAVFPSENYFYQTLTNLCKEAQLSRKIYPYMFRHTRITDLAEKEVSEYKLKAIAGWTPNSRMASKYIHLSGRVATEAVLEAEGITQHSDKKTESFQLKRCPRCNTENEQDAVYCYKCSLILDDKTLHAMQDKEEHSDELMNALMHHRTVQEAIKEALRELLLKGEVGNLQQKQSLRL